jgi:hypothetical protein
MNKIYENVLFEILNILLNKTYDSDKKVKDIYDTIADKLDGLYKRYLIEDIKKEIRRYKDILEQLEGNNY